MADRVDVSLFLLYNVIVVGIQKEADVYTVNFFRYDAITYFLYTAMSMWYQYDLYYRSYEQKCQKYKTQQFILHPDIYNRKAP